jgi:hypothetical protein
MVTIKAPKAIAPDTTKCQTSTIVDRFNRTLKCMKGESIVPDVLIKPNPKCSPFMSYRCEKCGCNSIPPYGGWYMCFRGGGAYIESWSIIGGCAVARISTPSSSNPNCFGVDAPPPIGYTVPGCRKFGRFLSFSKPLDKNIICFDFPTN